MAELDRGLAANLPRTADQIRSLVEKICEKAERVDANRRGRGKRLLRRAGNTLLRGPSFATRDCKQSACLFYFEFANFSHRSRQRVRRSRRAFTKPFAQDVSKRSDERPLPPA